MQHPGSHSRVCQWGSDPESGLSAAVWDNRHLQSDVAFPQRAFPCSSQEHVSTGVNSHVGTEEKE